MQPEEAFGFSRAEGLDHKQILYCCTLYVNKKEGKASKRDSTQSRACRNFPFEHLSRGSNASPALETTNLPSMLA
jgi:hypothetical protein